MTGSRWLADEQHGLHDLGERTQSAASIRALPETGGDPHTTAPRRYPLVELMDPTSFMVWCRIIADAALDKCQFVGHRCPQDRS